MKRLLSIFTIVIALSAAVSPTAHAQNPEVVLSWGGLCPTVVKNMDFTGPQPYVLWVGAKNLTASDRNVGSQVTLNLGPTVADAWRFDNSGCQGQSLITAYSDAAHPDSKSCPTMTGTNELRIYNYSYDPGTMRASLGMATSYDAFTPSPGVTYTLWKVYFDHTYSVAGVDGDPLTCDNAGQSMPISITAGVASSYLTLAAGGTPEAFTFANPSDQSITWGAGCGTTAVEPIPGLSSSIALRPSYPNPANGDSHIGFTLAAPAQDRVQVFDVAGRLVSVIHEGRDEAGPHEVTWDGKDSGGHPVGAGVYFIRVEIDGHAQSERLVRVP